MKNILIRINMVKLVKIYFEAYMIFFFFIFEMGGINNVKK